MENIDDLEKEMNTDAQLARIDKDVERLSDEWKDVKTDRFFMYFAELGNDRTHVIRVHTSNYDVIAVCVHMLRDVADKQPTEHRKEFVATIMKTVMEQLE